MKATRRGEAHDGSQRLQAEAGPPVANRLWQHIESSEKERRHDGDRQHSMPGMGRLLGGEEWFETLGSPQHQREAEQGDADDDLHGHQRVLEQSACADATQIH